MVLYPECELLSGAVRSDAVSAGGGAGACELYGAPGVVGCLRRDVVWRWGVAGQRRNSDGASAELASGCYGVGSVDETAVAEVRVQLWCERDDWVEVHDHLGRLAVR